MPALEACEEAALDAARLARDELLEDLRAQRSWADMRVPAVSGCRT
jgi:hypothetical protein